MSRNGWAALPHGATGLSAVCDCGISWSYSLTIFVKSSPPQVSSQKTKGLVRIRVRCTTNRSHSTPCKKGRIRASANCYKLLLGLFSASEWQNLSFTYQNSEKEPTLIISFSQYSPFFGGQSKHSGWNPTGVIRYVGSVPGSLWQNSPHKDAVLCISLTNIDQCWITCSFKVE